MLQVRKLVLAVAAATAMSSGVAHALGLGEVTIKSALDQPLLAEIELLETKGLGADEIRSRLASAEDFSLAGVERPFFLTNLRFTPVIRDGRNFVRITSDQAIREPFLNFLVEVYWPNGRMLKEYTLLLDPPMYTPQQVVYSAPPMAAPITAAPAVSRPQAPAARTQALPRQQAAPAARPALKEGEYRVQKNDTLWEIALRAGGQGASVHQTMLAIQDLNPDAFLGGNINRLKSGQVLKLPTEGQVRQRNVREAVAEVQAQEQAWRTGSRPQQQLDARERSTADAAPAQAKQQDNLRLVAAEAGDSSIGSDQGNAARVQDQLAQTKEQLDSAQRENQDLNSRVEELNSQVEKLQRLLELKNDQLANLQNLESAAELDGLEEALTEPVIEGDGQEDILVDEAVETAVELSVAEEDFAADDFSTVAESLIDEVETAEEETPSIEEQIALELQAQEQAADTLQEVEEPVAVQPAPVIEQPVEQRSFFEELLGNPMFLPAAGAGAAGLLLLLLLARRKSQGKAAKEEAAPEFAADGGDELPLVAGLDDGTADALAPAFAEEVSAQDPLVEAENYISYGRFSQASDVLLKAIDQEPHREDLRIKLLEVFADLEDPHSFNGQFEELIAMGASAETLDGLRQRYSHLLEAVPSIPEPGNDFDLPAIDELPDLPELPDAADPLADGFPELDDFLDETTSESTADDEFAALLDDAASAVTAQAEETADVLEMPDFELPDLPDLDERDQPLDFVLDDFKPEEGQAEAESVLPEAVAEDDELSLDMDFDLSLPVEDAAPEVAAADEDGFLDLEAELQNVSSDLDSVLGEGNDLGLGELSLDDLSDSKGPDLADAAGLDLDLDLDALLGGEAAEESAEALPALDELSFDLDTPELDNLEVELPAVEAAELSDADMSAVSALEQDLGDDLDFLSGTDETTTKLDLAQALTDMGDLEGAKDILDEVVNEGNPEQQQQARDMLDKLS